MAHQRRRIELSQKQETKNRVVAKRKSRACLIEPSSTDKADNALALVQRHVMLF
jgi:hypothetical protein